MNAGQTCVAPDYVLCTKEVQAKFIEEAKKVLTEWYGQKQSESPYLGRIVNKPNFEYVFITDKCLKFSTKTILFADVWLT